MRGRGGRAGRGGCKQACWQKVWQLQEAAPASTGVTALDISQEIATGGKSGLKATLPATSGGSRHRAGSSGRQQRQAAAAAAAAVGSHACISMSHSAHHVQHEVFRAGAVPSRREIEDHRAALALAVALAMKGSDE